MLYRQNLSASEVAIALVLSFAFAAFILACNHVGLTQVGPIPYGNDGGCDNWGYFGRMLNPQSGNYLAPFNRGVGRVMYFAPVHAMHRAVPQINVGLLAYYLYFPIGLLSLYIALRALFSCGITVLAYVLTGLNPLLLNMNYQTYATQGSFVYNCCMLAALVWGSTTIGHQSWRSKALFSLAGLFFVLSLNAHLAAIMFNAGCCLLAFAACDAALVYPRRLLRTIAGMLVPFIFGAAAGVVLIAVISRLFGLSVGGALSYQLRDVGGLLGLWQYPGWTRETQAFGLMALASLLCLFAVVHNRNASKRYRWSLSVIACSVILTCILNVIETIVLKDQQLVYDYFYFLLLPYVALAFCAAFNADSIAVGRAAFWLAASVAVGAALSINVYLALNAEDKSWLLNHTQAIFYVAIVLMICALALVSANRSCLVVATLCFALCLQIASGSNSRNAAFDALSEARTISDTAQRALIFLFEHLSENPVIWVARAGNGRAETPIVRGLMRCVFTPSFPDELPDPRDYNQPALAVGKTLVLVATSATSAAEIDEALSRFRYSFRVEAQQFFPMQGFSGASGLQVTVGKMETSPPSPDFTAPQ
jgi:hypothetical protein